MPSTTLYALAKGWWLMTWDATMVVGNIARAASIRGIKPCVRSGPASRMQTYVVPARANLLPAATAKRSALGLNRRSASCVGMNFPHTTKGSTYRARALNGMNSEAQCGAALLVLWAEVHVSCGRLAPLSPAGKLPRASTNTH